MDSLTRRGTWLRKYWVRRVRRRNCGRRMDRPGWGSQPAAKSPLIRRIKKVRLHFRSFVRSRGDAGCEDGEPTSLSHYLSLVLLRAPPLPPSLAPLAFLISAELIKVFARVSMTCCPCPPHSASCFPPVALQFGHFRVGFGEAVGNGSGSERTFMLAWLTQLSSRSFR